MKIPRFIVDNSRPLTMIAAMCCGVTLHEPISKIDYATGFYSAPTLIFGMLFVTFCKVKISDMRITKMHITLLLFQILAAIGIYYLTLPLLGATIAQGAMICFLAPIAMGAVVIGGILGANIVSIASYSLLCNFAIAVVAPYILAAFGNGECTFPEIMSRVVPLLILPFILAQTLKALWYDASKWISHHGGVSFYLWLFAMAITLSRTTSYILNYDGEASLREQFALAAIALAACIIQFISGRIIGHRYDEPTAAGQSLGQKNTVLAVWLAHSFLNPIASIAPTAYIIWQNLINSLQIYLHDKKIRHNSRQ